MKFTTLASSVLLLGAAVSSAMRVPKVARLETPLGLSDGVYFPENVDFSHTFLYRGHTSGEDYLPSSAPFHMLSTPSTSISQRFRPKQTLKRRYVGCLTAPQGYVYAWVIDGYRLAIATNGEPGYLTRTTVRQSGTTTQADINSCTAFCDATPSCTMASVIRFIDFPEGDVICAAYSSVLPVGNAKYTTGTFNGPGQVKSSYTFNRRAGKSHAF